MSSKESIYKLGQFMLRTYYIDPRFKKMNRPPSSKNEWFSEHSIICDGCGKRNCLKCRDHCFSCPYIFPHSIINMDKCERASIKETQTKQWSYDYAIKCSVDGCVDAFCCKCADVCFICKKSVCTKHYEIIETDEEYIGVCVRCIGCIGGCDDMQTE